MSNLPEKPERLTVITEKLSMELDSEDVEAIVLEWAKSRGFSHRAEIEFCVRWESLSGAIITESQTKTEGG